jgi:excisionase family DNA binding protein
MENKLESIADASRRLGVSTFTTRRLIKAKQLRAVRVGKRVLVPQSEIERVIAEGCGTSVSKPTESSPARETRNGR